jgi:uncharacterized protein YjdB
MSTRTFILAVTGLALSVAACGSYGTSVVEVGKTRTPVASVSVAVPLSLAAGQTARAIATPKDANGTALTDRPVTWYTASASIASVNDSGLISAVAPGTTVVSAVSEGVAGRATMAVVPPPPTPIASVSVSPATSSLQVGGTVQLSAVTRDANNNVLTGQVVTWSSSNTGISTVSATGLVTAIAAGSATITALSETKTGTAATTVSAPAPVPVASVSVSLGASTLNPGQTTQATATTRDANNNVLTGRVISWSSSNTSVATVSSSGLVMAVAVGPAQITAMSENQSGSATLTVAAPPPPPSGSVEPSGMTPLTERPFSAMIEDSWYFDSGNQTNVSIVQDATAPKSPSSIMQMLFPAGMIGGIGPNSLERDWTAGTYKTLYVSYWMKVSNNFYGHCGPEITKTIHFWVGDGTVSGNKLYTNIRGCGSAALSSWVNLQGVVAGGNFDSGTSAEFGPNLGQPATIVRGQWQRYEFVFKGNTAGTADGTLDWWLDGVYVGSYSGIQYTPGAATWSTLKWGPTWGGLGGTVPADMYEWMDHFYVSGKP